MTARSPPYPTRYLICVLGAKLLWRGDTSTVVGMDSAQKIKPRDLVVGGRYLHRNGLFIREITEINGNTVGYLDEGKDRWCSNSVFVRACPTVATPEDEANALTACAFRNGFLEDLHAGKSSELLTQPGLSRISDEEMRKLMIQASAKWFFRNYLVNFHWVCLRDGREEAFRVDF